MSDVEVTDEAVEAGVRAALDYWAGRGIDVAQTLLVQREVEVALSAAAPLIAARAIAETREVAAELARERTLMGRALPILRYVSAGRRYVGVAPYPDAAARALLGEMEASRG